MLVIVQNHFVESRIVALHLSDFEITATTIVIEGRDHLGIHLLMRTGSDLE